MKHLKLRLFCGFHLLVMIVGVLPLNRLSPTFITYFLSPYARLTEAGASYGFFSPNVGNQIRVAFEVKDSLGNIKPYRLEENVTSEVGIRIGNMYRLLAEVYGNEKLRRKVSASFSSQVFKGHTDAQSVKIRVERYDIPGLSGWKAGSRVIESPLYSAVFKRG